MTLAVCVLDKWLFHFVCETLGLSPFVVHLFGTFWTALLTFWIHVLIYSYLYEQNRNHRLWKKTLSVVLWNQLFWQTLAGCVFVYVQSISHSESIFVNFIKLIGCAIVTDFVFYAMHSLLHHRMFWILHKKHHEITHPIAVATLYCHFLQHVFCNILSIFSGPILFQLGPVITWWWIALATSSSVTSHCGQNITWLGSPSPLLHYLHHSNLTFVSRSISGFPDWIFGTYLKPLQKTNETDTTN